MEPAADAGGADGVELVDEDDRRRVLARLLEELADARGAEAREHLDERRRALRVEVRAGRARDGLRDERLPRAGRAVQQDPAGHTRAEALEALPVAQELDDLDELLLRLVEPGDVVPGHLDLRAAHDRCRLRARHELERVQEQDDDDPEEHDREPRQERVLEIHPHGYRQRAERAEATAVRGVRARGRRRAPRSRPRAGPATARRSRGAAGARSRVGRAGVRADASGCARPRRRPRPSPPMAPAVPTRRARPCAFPPEPSQRRRSRRATTRPSAR